MRTRLPLGAVLTIGAALACFEIAALPAWGVIVDRVAITVGEKVITQSEIDRRIRLTAFENGEPADLSLTSQRQAAQRLVDLKLIETEMDVGHYQLTSPAQANALLTNFTMEHFRSSTEALRLALQNADLTAADLQTDLAEQADLLSFLNLRFRPAVEIGDQDIEKYYHENIESKNPAKPISLSDARASIEQILGTQRADADLDAWLQDHRKQTRISYLVKDLQ